MKQPQNSLKNQNLDDYEYVRVFRNQIGHLTIRENFSTKLGVFSISIFFCENLVCKLFFLFLALIICIIVICCKQINLPALRLFFCNLRHMLDKRSSFLSTTIRRKGCESRIENFPLKKRFYCLDLIFEWTPLNGLVMISITGLILRSWDSKSSRLST